MADNTERDCENQFDMVCPKCGASDEIDVAATVWVRLCEDGTDATNSGDGDQEWEPTSACVCRTCGHGATVADFEINTTPSPDETQEPERITRANAAMDDYRKQHPDHGEAMPRELLADLMHWCRDNGTDFDHELSLATDFFSDEQEGE